MEAVGAAQPLVVIAVLGTAVAVAGPMANVDLPMVVPTHLPHPAVSAMLVVILACGARAVSGNGPVAAVVEAILPVAGPLILAEVAVDSAATAPATTAKHADPARETVVPVVDSAVTDRVVVARIVDHAPVIVVPVSPHLNVTGLISTALAVRVSARAALAPGFGHALLQAMVMLSAVSPSRLRAAGLLPPAARFPSGEVLARPV